MQAVTTIGLDIAKSVFQVHGVDADGHVVVRRQLKRRQVVIFFEKLPPCLVRLITLLVAPAAGPWAWRAADAAGLCEALTLRRLVKRSQEPTCGSYRPRRLSSKTG